MKMNNGCVTMTNNNENTSEVDLKIPCPILGLRKGESTEVRQYTHSHCGNDLQMVDDGSIICKQCDIKEDLSRWKFIEGNNQLELLPDDGKIDHEQLKLLSMNLGLYLLQSAGIEWVQRFLNNFKD